MKAFGSSKNVRILTLSHVILSRLFYLVSSIKNGCHAVRLKKPTVVGQNVCVHSLDHCKHIISSQGWEFKGKSKLQPFPNVILLLS